MIRTPHRLGLILLCTSLLAPAAFAADDKPAKPAKPDLSAPATAGSGWQGMSRLAAKGNAKKQNGLLETFIKITDHDGESFEFDYWITLGANHGSSDRRGLHLVGTINQNGVIQVTPQKILAGAWQNPNLLDEKWTGQVIADKKTARIVLHRQMDNGMVEIGVIKKN